MDTTPTTTKKFIPTTEVKSTAVRTYTEPATNIEFINNDGRKDLYTWVYIAVFALALCLVLYFFAGVFFAGIMLLISLAYMLAVGYSGIKITSAIGDIAHNQIASVRITAKNPKDLWTMAAAHYGGPVIAISILLVTFGAVVSISIFGILTTTQTFVAIIPRLNSTSIVDTAALRKEITSSVISRMTNSAYLSVHRVEKGETLKSIAAIYGTTAAKIIALNPLISPSTLSIGQEIAVPLR